MSEMKKEEPREMNLVPTENVDKRTAFSKTYTVGPGKYQAFTSVIPLHRQNEETGKWDELDAAFKAEKENDVLESVGAQLTVSCGVSGEKAFIAVKDQEDHRLSWGYEEAEAVKPEAVKEEVKEEDHVLQAFCQAMANAQGTVRYSEIFPGVDMICRNDSRFKDEFVFSASEFARKIVCRLESNGLELSVDENGTIVAFDTDGKKIYNIPAPTLTDNEGQEGMVQVSLEGTEDGYRLIYEPDPEFMESAAYPVVLDPYIRTYNQDYAIDDTYVCSKFPNNNYGTNERVYAQRTEYQGVKDIRYGLVRVNTLPNFGANHYITNASLVMRTVNVSGTNPHLYIREIQSTWTDTTATWNKLQNGEILYSDIIQDYVALGSGNIFFNITGLVRKWYQNGSTNFGVLITPWEGYCIGAFYGSDSGVTGKPYLKVEYASLAGLEDYLTYDTVSAGKAGTGYVSLVNGNLVFTHSDTQMNGARMPVSVTHVYNSCDADKNDYYCGYGWRTNFHQTLHKELLDSVTYYVYTDGDGTEHWFKSAGSGKYKDESGLSMELTVGSDEITIRDKGDNKLTFPLISATPTATQPTAKVLVTTISDACGNKIKVTATGMKITKLTDGASDDNDPDSGRETVLEYSNNLLARIKLPWQSNTDCVRFTYTSQRLTGITYEDGNSSSYTYHTQSTQAHRLLTKAISPEGIQAEFTYDNVSAAVGLPHEVRFSKVSDGQTSNSLIASHTMYTYGAQLCLVTDQLTGNHLRYHFNDNGNCTSVDDGLGYAVYAEYDQSGSNADAPINHPTTTSRVERAVNNLLTNGLFGKTTDWTKDGTGTITQSARSGGFGVNQKKFTVANGQTLSCYQTVGVTAEQTYTLSGYVQSFGAKAYLKVTAGSAVFTSLSVELAGNETETELTRTQVTFTVPPAVSQIRVDLVAEGTPQGTIAWWDSAQLEIGETANHVNLLENSDVHDMQGTLPTPWQKDNTYSTVIARSEDMPAHVTGNALRITGKCDTIRRVWQSANVSGLKNDRFTVGGWCSAYAKKKVGTDVICQLLVYFATSNSNNWSDWSLGGSASFHHEEGTWQFACGDVKAPRNYSWIRVVMAYNKQVNFVDFSNLFLYKEQYGTDYVYDAKGNRKSSTSSAGVTGNKTYDAYNNILTSAAPGRTVTTTFDWGSTETEKRKHLLKKATSPLGTVSTFQYDSYGNQTESKVSESSSASAKFMKTTTAYTAAGTYAASQMDARGKTVSYVTDANKGVVTKVTDPSLQEVNSQYDVLRRPTKTSTMLNGQEVKTESTYDAQKGYLTTVKHNTTTAASGDVTYTFGYDNLGRQTSVQVGSNVLSTTAYDALTRQISQVNFGNGDKVQNTYDSYGRLIGVRYDDETVDRFTYRYDATGRVGMVEDHEQETLTYADYDLAGRPARKTKLRNGAHVYTGKVRYNGYELPADFTELVGENKEKHSTAFTYDNENRVTDLTYDESTDKVSYLYDALGRITKKTVHLGTQDLETTYTYVPGSEANGTTSLIQTITQNGVTLTYTYDDNGNITSVSDGTKTVSYVYDAIGQLIRVNDPYDNRSGSDGTTWTFEYDLGGNILNRKRYAYTTGTLPSSYLQRILYAYGDSTWKDKLTSYNGVAIDTDDIGNITEYGAWTYQWRHGRELVHMSRSQYPIEVDFKYNEDGLRTKKTITDTSGATPITTVTEYTLHGKNIVHLTQGNQKLHFFYDGQGKPSIVEWNNNGTIGKYAYVYNLQGDVIALVNSSGTKVVNYAYDAWGKPFSKTGTLASTLGKLNPFRYRGYVYDEEIDFYYLRSRYYNANRGRFINADSVFDGTNLFRYCANDSINNSDTDGYNVLDVVYPKVPASYIIEGVCGLEKLNITKYVDGGKTAEKCSCIGLILQFVEEFYKGGIIKYQVNIEGKIITIGQGTNSAVGNNVKDKYKGFKPIPKNSSLLNDLLPGTLVYTDDFSHIGIYVGYYIDRNNRTIEHCVIDCTRKRVKDPEKDEDGVYARDINNCRFTQYCTFNYMNYDLSYEDTVNYYCCLK